MQQRADDREVALPGDVEQHGVGARRGHIARAKGGGVLIGGVGDRGDLAEALRLKMQAQIGFPHRRRGMAAHRRVAVDAMDLARRAGGREEMTEQAVAAQTGLPADDRRRRARKAGAQRRQGDGEIADLRRAVEGRTAFVVQHAHAETREEGADRRERRGDVGAAHRPRRSGQAQRVKRPEARGLRRRRQARQQQRAQPGLRIGRERIGRAGEIVAIPADERRAAAHARGPKKASAAASSGAERAAVSTGTPAIAASQA